MNESSTLYTDASNIGIGAILVQDHGPIGIYSHKLPSTEGRYTTTELEVLAIIKAIQNFKKIIFGSEIKIITDNKNLIFDKPIETSQMQR